MVDEIQPVTIGAGARIAMETAIRNGDGDGDELVLLSGCQDLTAATFKVDYPTSLDERRFDGIFSDGRNKAMFDRPGSRREMDMVAWERRWNEMNLWFSGYISPTGPLDVRFVRRDHELDNLRSLR